MGDTKGIAIFDALLETQLLLRSKQRRRATERSLRYRRQGWERKVLLIDVARAWAAVATTLAVPSEMADEYHVVAAADSLWRRAIAAESERDTLRSALRGADEEIARLRARVAKLEGALRQVASVGCGVCINFTNGRTCLTTGIEPPCTGCLPEFARALLSRSEEQTEAALNLDIAEAEGDNDYIAECCDDAGSPRTSDDGEITIGIVGRVEWMRDRIAELREELAASRRNEAASGGADE